MDAATPLWHRRRLLEIDLDSGVGASARIEPGGVGAADPVDIVLRAEVVGSGQIPAVELTIPVSNSVDLLPHAIAANGI